MSLPALLLIHGMWSRPSTFAKLRQELEAAGLQSAALTLPYHDLPPGAPAPANLATLRLEAYRAAVKQAAAAIEGPIVVLGHSMGGLLAQLLAQEINPKGLILLSTAPSAQAGRYGTALNLSSLQAFSGINGRWGWWREPTLIDERRARLHIYNGVPEEEVRPALSDLTWDSGAVLAQMALPLFDKDKGSRVDYSRIRCPSLVITGLEDRIVPPTISKNTARLLATNGAPVDYEEWPNVGHWLFHDLVRPKLAAAISRFVATL